MGNPQVTCWTCRSLNEEAGSLQIDAVQLKAWRESCWSRMGWTFLVCIIAGAACGLFAFGGTFVMGLDIARICELAVGVWTLSTSAFVMSGVGFCLDHGRAELKTLQLAKRLKGGLA